jgi:predicted glutamine amidotransferase
MFGKNYYCKDDFCIMEPSTGRPTAIVIASEPFTLRRSDWMKVERNVMMIVDETMQMTFTDIVLPIEEKLQVGYATV